MLASSFTLGRRIVRPSRASPWHRDSASACSVEVSGGVRSHARRVTGSITASAVSSYTLGAGAPSGGPPRTQRAAQRSVFGRVVMFAAPSVHARGVARALGSTDAVQTQLTSNAENAALASLVCPAPPKLMMLTPSIRVGRRQSSSPP